MVTITLCDQRRAPHFAQKASMGPSGFAQMPQIRRGLDARSGSGAASGRTGWIGVPHLVQNLSLGTPPLPHAGHVQPVRRNRAMRAPARWPVGGYGAGGQEAGAGGGPVVGIGAAGATRRWRRDAS